MALCQSLSDAPAILVTTLSPVQDRIALALDLAPNKEIQWTHLQLISFAIAPVVLLIVHLLKRRSEGAIANKSTVQTNGCYRSGTNVAVVIVVLGA